MTENTTKKIPTIRKNPANSISYDSEFHRSKEARRHNFAFCQVYFIEEEHGAWTRSLDIISRLYVIKYKLINGCHYGLYEFCKSLANQRIQLSTRGLAEYFEVSTKTISEWLDRLQDVNLLHRVCRADANGGGHDYIIHTPFMYDVERDENNKIVRYDDDSFGKLIVPELRQRIKDKFTKTNRAKRLEEVTDKNGITRLMRRRDKCCPDHLRLDLREIRMLFHDGVTKEENDDKIPRRFWKPDKHTDNFFTIVRDALREIHRRNIRPIAVKSETEKRTANWNIFKDILRGYCENERIDIELTDPRYKAAWFLANYYAPNVFHYVEI